MTTQVTDGGIQLATAAIGGGPKININLFKVGSTIVNPIPDDPTTDITGDLVFTGDALQLQYAIVDNNTVEYIVTLDESIGNFDVGRIGLFHDNGDGTYTLFSITALDTPNPDHKFSTSGNQVGDRLTYAIYLGISNMAKITTFTIPILPLLSVPEAQTETALDDPNHVVFNTAQVWRHSFTRVPVLAYRETPTQGWPFSAWFMRPERSIPGQGEGIIALDQSFFDSGAPIGTVVGLDSPDQKIIKGEPATNQYIIGIRSSVEEITNYGLYVDPVNTYNPMQKLYVDTGNNAGNLTTISNNWPIGYAIGPVVTTNAAGYLCWIDFSLGTFGGDTIGIPGPPGPTGPKGPSGSGAVVGISTPGCYLKLIGANLVLTPYNGNLIVINQQVQKIPYQGVVLAPTGLSPNTRYYIYAYMNGATMMLEASATTTNHMTSTIDGVEIKSGDQSRTLVGMAVTIAGPAWTDIVPSTLGPGSGGAIAGGVNVGKLYVLSWFNPRPKSCTTYFDVAFISPKVHSGHRTTSPEFVELGIEIRNFFLTWQGREVRYVTGGNVAVLAPHGAGSAIQFDGTGYERFATSAHTGGSDNMWFPVAIQGAKKGLSEGQHFCTMLGVYAGVNTQGAGPWWAMGQQGNGPWLDAPVAITVTVDG